VQLVDGEDVVGGVELVVRAGMLERPRPLLPDDANRRVGFGAGKAFDDDGLLTDTLVRERLVRFLADFVEFART
jgi:hypothetical protein